MQTAEHSSPILSKILLAGVASATLALGAAGIAAATDTTAPGDDATEHTEHPAPPASLAVDGSAEASSPEAEALCTAVGAVDAAMSSEDEAAIGEAVGAVTDAAQAVPDAAPLVETVLANAENTESPEFAEAYGALIEWMKGNCGFAEIDVTAAEFQFEGVPVEIPAGPAIITLENAGDQVHEFAVMRINDDVTLSLEELLALPEEESETMVTPAAFAFAFPGEVGFSLADLTPGRYVALCFLPEGATPEVLMQLEELGVDGPEDTIPADAGLELGPPHFTKGMVHEFTVA